MTKVAAAISIGQLWTYCPAANEAMAKGSVFIASLLTTSKGNKKSFQEPTKVNIPNAESASSVEAF